MNLCPCCGAPYDAPRVIWETGDLDGEGHFYTGAEARCPGCGFPAGALADRADRCGCGEWKLRSDPCCRECLADLRRRYAAFAGTLTAGQEEALYDALDGVGVGELLIQWSDPPGGGDGGRSGHGSGEL